MSVVKRSDILDAAKRATCGERDVQYGTPEDNFARIADLWNAHLRIRKCVPPSHALTAEDVAWMLMQVKQARAVHGFHLDNYIDAAGYVVCGGEIASNTGSK